MGPLRIAAFRRSSHKEPVAAIASTEVAPALFALFDELADETRHSPALIAPSEDPIYDVIPPDAPLPYAGQDPLALVDSLDLPARRRLLEFLLGFCRTAFRLGSDSDFASACAHLAGLCSSSIGSATVVADVLPGRVLLRGVVSAPGDTLYLLGSCGTRQIRSPNAAMVGDADGLVIIPTPHPTERLLSIGSEVRIWQIHQVASPVHVLALTGAALTAARSACIAAFAPAATGSAEAALLHELHVLAPAAPRRVDDPALPIGGAVELALADGDGGVFLAGWLRDPLELVAGAELLTPVGRQPVAADALHRISRPDLRAMLAKAAHGANGSQRIGFVARLPDPTFGGALQPTLRLTLRSGAAIELTPPLRSLSPQAARDAVLSSVTPPEALGDVLGACLVPAATGLHRLARAQRGRERVVPIGSRAASPDVSILVPLYRVLGFLRFQLAAFAEDPACRASEIVYALDSPEQANEVEHLLRGLSQLHDMPITLVIMERNGGFAAATNAAARQASGRAFMLLNSDVIPVGPGWLDALKEARRRTGAVAATAKLLFDDGSLQHAGLYFARDAAGNWFNNHYHKGLPRGWPGADTPRLVPGGTGAALLIDRARFEQAGGVCEDYVVGDYEDSDLCLRLQEAGGTIVYEPRAELYHFERRSISLHAGYMRTLACQYNRHVHHQRWDDAMSELMAMPAFSPGAVSPVRTRTAV
jgi:GT2 family glycosyltransferase